MAFVLRGALQCVITVLEATVSDEPAELDELDAYTAARIAGLAPPEPGCVFVAMIADRHTDVEAFLFASGPAAIQFAHDQALGFAQTRGDVEVPDETPDGWLFLLHYSAEGDAVWVLEKHVEGGGDG